MVQRYTFPEQTILSNVGDPTNATDVATKEYVDSSASALRWQNNATTVFTPYQIAFNSVHPANGEAVGSGVPNPLPLATSNGATTLRQILFAGDRISIRNNDGTIIYWGNGYAGGNPVATAKAPLVGTLTDTGIGTYVNMAWSDGGDTAALDLVGWPAPAGAAVTIWKESGTKPAIIFNPVNQIDSGDITLTPTATLGEYTATIKNSGSGAQWPYIYFLATRDGVNQTFTNALLKDVLATDDLIVTHNGVQLQPHVGFEWNQGTTTLTVYAFLRIFDSIEVMPEGDAAPTGLVGVYAFPGSNVVCTPAFITDTGSVGLKTQTLTTTSVGNVTLTVGSDGVLTALTGYQNPTGVLSIAWNGAPAQIGDVVISQVQADWNATSGYAQILNKPASVSQVQADWNLTAGNLGYIANKPSFFAFEGAAIYQRTASPNSYTFTGDGTVNTLIFDSVLSSSLPSYFSYNSSTGVLTYTGTNNRWATVSYCLNVGYNGGDAGNTIDGILTAVYINGTAAGAWNSSYANHSDFGIVGLLDNYWGGVGIFYLSPNDQITIRISRTCTQSSLGYGVGTSNVSSASSASLFQISSWGGG